MGYSIGEFIRDVLDQASERDMVLQADLIASCSSLLRFLCIRDKVKGSLLRVLRDLVRMVLTCSHAMLNQENRTGIRSEGVGSVSAVLQRIRGRLHARIHELTPPPAHDHQCVHPSTTSAGGHAQYHADDEFNRLLILEAVLESTLTGFS